MRALLLMKKQKEWDKELKKEKVTLSIEDTYQKLDYKDKEIIFNNKKILLKAIEQLMISNNSYIYGVYSIYINSFQLKNEALSNLTKEYVEFLFDLKKKMNIKLDFEVFIFFSMLENIYYIGNKYKIGEKLIEKIENNIELRKNIGSVKISKEIKKNSVLNEIITKNIRYAFMSLKIKKSNVKLDLNIDKYFNIKIIDNF